jgi:hypothetical protein
MPLVIKEHRNDIEIFSYMENYYIDFLITNDRLVDSFG